jgi:hypothetical protein
MTEISHLALTSYVLKQCKIGLNPSVMKGTLLESPKQLFAPTSLALQRGSRKVELVISYLFAASSAALDEICW